MLERIGGLEHFEIVGQKLLHDEGYMKTWKLWLKGHIANLPESRFIEGWSGPETEYIYRQFFYRIFEVKQAYVEKAKEAA